MIVKTLTFIGLVMSLFGFAQQPTHVAVQLEGQPLPSAFVRASSFDITTLTNINGTARLDLTEADTLVISHLDIESSFVYAKPGDSLVIEGKASGNGLLNQVVVTSTRTHLDRRESAVPVQVMNRELLQATQSISVAEGLSFRPGLRLEYNCQNCGFSQVRLNGLNGPYSQILIDGRPIFSALSGVYGLEQIPSSMIERVEVVRGGGSSMYGGNAIAGTINLITREPVIDEWEVSTQTTLNGMESPDISLQGNAAWVDENSGLQVWGSGRSREPFNANPQALYDRDGDGVAETKDDFSEITKLRSAAVGARYWYRPSTTQRLQIETRGLYEFRRGGNRFEVPADRADIAEELIHRTAGINGQYEWMRGDGLERFTVYGASTYTNRSSYYGAGGNSPDSATRAQARQFYGQTEDVISNVGALYGWGWNEFHNVMVGIDIQHNQVSDVMPGYSRDINQTVFTPAVYTQWQWKLNEHWTTLMGVRYDRPTIQSINAFAGEPALQSTNTYEAVNPRISLLYKLNHQWRFRAGYASGFRAPQAFDEDLHLSILGGDARIVQLSPNLEVETSHSFNLGAETDIHVGNWKGRISLDGFYTLLDNPFVDIPFTGYVVNNNDTIAILDTKVNDPSGAWVSGVNIETEWVNANWALQAGWTFQQAQYGEAREWYPNESTNRILRAPNSYGYAIFGYIPNDKWRFDISGTFTGSMITPNERTQRLEATPFFADVNASVQRTWRIKNTRLTMEAGVYNLLDQYQEDIEVGWERDASYFYGPIRPFSAYLSFTIGM